ncbi:hypothetical protein M8J75_002759 [Diaphorina citri]|nr:hypothetical protein M8J75_002759 [Diaphorina citri]
MDTKSEAMDYEIEEILSTEHAMELDLPTESIESETTSADENVLQQMYVDGQITFSEYSSRLGALFQKLEADDPLEEEIEEVEEVTMGLDDLDEDTEEASTSVATPDKKVVKKKQPKQKTGEGKKKEKILRPRVKLPNALKGMLGEATLMFVKKDNRQKAIEMVLEVVRQLPTAPEAYKTLATMYEDVGDLATSIKMLLIGAHLSSDNAEEWTRLGAHFEKVGDQKQAISCYSKALKQDVSRVDIHDRRLRLCDEIGLKNRGFVLAGYQRYLKNITPDSDPQTILDLSTRAAHVYHTARNFPQAASSLAIAFQHSAHLIRPEHCNLYLEVLLELKSYETCVEVLRRFANIEITYFKPFPQDSTSGEENNIQITNYTVPSDPNLVPPPEILSKFVITLVHLRSETQFPTLLASLEFDVEMYGDVYLDIAEALIQEHYEAYAVQVLVLLVSSEKYNQPGVWKQLAETYEKSGKIEECKAAYRKVLEQVPLHIDIRRHLADIYMKENNVQEALSVLSQLPRSDQNPVESHRPKTPKGRKRETKTKVPQDSRPLIPSSSPCDEPPSDLISSPLLVDQLKLMMKTGQSYENPQEYYSLLNLVLSQHSIQVINPDESRYILSRVRTPKKIEHILIQRGLSKDTILDNRARFTSEPAPSFYDINLLYRHSFDVARQQRDFAPLLHIVIQAMCSTVLIKDSTEHLDQLSLDATTVLYKTGHIPHAYQLFRVLMLKNLDSKVVLNLMNLITLRSSDIRIVRNTLRTFQSKPNNLGLNVMYANNCNLTNNLKYCINEYAIISRNVEHKHPLYLLLLAVSYGNIACNKFITKRPLLVTHAFAWISKYKTRRGAQMSQEVCYNIGRLCHQIGLLSQAVSFYKKGLSAQPCFPQYDLRAEIAYNLHLIYLHSNAIPLAQHVLQTYAVI